MALNRYKLRHLAENKHRTAMLVEKLLKRPDRLIGLILLGNNFVNILAAQIVTVIALKLYGDYAIAIGGGIFTLVVLIFAEVMPKTLAAVHPERIAFPAAWVYWLLQKPTLPLVWLINQVTNNLLRIFGVKAHESRLEQLSREELRTVVAESSPETSARYQHMLLSILDLNQLKVEDIMVPRKEIEGLDLAQSWDEVLENIRGSHHTRLPIYEESIDNVIGIIHLRRILPQAIDSTLTEADVRKIARAPFFVPEGTPLNKQLRHFQQRKRRIGLVVDEYGDIQGLVTLEDILEEIVGEFTTDPIEDERDLQHQGDGRYLVSGSTPVRVLNRDLGWELPIDGPKTINGLILEYLEVIPKPKTSVKIAGYPIEIVETTDTQIVTVDVGPRLNHSVQADPEPQ